MIGVFDSGNGGLTVLRALVARLPERVFLYLGDHRHAPYGEREDAEIIDLTRASVTRLFDRGCRLVLLACNTAAAVALRRLQQDWLPDAYPERRVLGVFVPMVEAVTEVPWHLEAPPGEMRPGGTPREPPPEPATVGVFATRRTVASGAYPREIAKRAPQIRVVQQACPGLVGLIEAGAGTADLEAAIAGHVGDFMARLGGAAPDSVILGCTHYPLVAGAFAAALPEGVRLHSQPELVADSLAGYLARHPEFDLPTGPRRTTRFLTTGDPAAIAVLTKRFFGAALQFQRV